jgi:osmoprotectant transport system permease protein
MKKTIKFSLILLLVISAFLPALAQDNNIKIGSKKFPESQLLAEIISILISEKTSLKVERKFGLGSTAICFEALRTKQIDLYPEYTGTGLTAILKESIESIPFTQVYEKVSQDFEKNYNIIWLKPFGFNNTYALAVSKKLGIKNISDLANYKDIKVAFSHEFLNRKDGYLGLSKHYNFTLNDIRGMEHGLVYKSIASGDIDLTDAYSTDGNLVKYGLTLLTDDKNFFPPYDAVPIIRKEVLEANPELKTVLASLANQINDDEMRELNYQVEVKGESFKTVAQNFLLKKQLITSTTKSDENRSLPLLNLLLEHLYLTISATFLSTLVGLPLGIFISKNKTLANPILSIAGIIQTVPSLAILGFMIPFLGIGFAPAISALFLYGLLPIIRNTYTGITSVDPLLKEAAKGMGLTNNQTLFMLELPLATKIIMAGIRTAMVINIGTATLAAFIGAGGLGELIVTGLSLNNNEMILSGAIPSALLAIVVDFILARLENFLEPKGLKAK